VLINIQDGGTKLLLLAMSGFTVKKEMLSRETSLGIDAIQDPPAIQRAK
jgi:hypothetical protein